MSLRVWLPLNGDLRNQGLDGGVSITNSGATIDNSGKTGKCYEFNGVDQYLTINNFNCLNWENFSFSCWCYPTNNFNYLFLIRGNSQHRVRISGDGFMFRDNNNTSSQRVVSFGQTIPINAWTHLVCIYARGEIFIYINGILTSHSTAYYHSNSHFLSDFDQIRIARQQTTSGNNYYAGKINDIRIYDHALSEKEVKEVAKGLILHYKLNEVPVEINNAYSTPYFDVDNQNGGWNHWGASGSSGSFARNHDKQYIFFKNKERNHAASNAATATGDYLVYQSPAFDGGFRSLQCIVKEKNSNPITEAIVCPTWNAHMSDGAAPNKWTNIIDLGDGFYLCQIDGIHQSGSNDLIGFRVKPGYTVYFSAAWCENDKEVCSDIFSDIDLIEDTSGYNYINTPVGTINVDKDTPRYDKAALFDGSSYLALGKQLYNARDEMTVNLWCKKDWTKNVGTPFSCVQTGGFGWQVNGANYTFYCGTGASSNTYISKALTVNNLSAGWHMLSATYDGLTLRLYIDGELNSTVNKYSTKTLLFYNNNSGMFIGGESSGALMTTTTDRFKGSISDVRIYCTALSADDIKELYQTSASIDDKQNFYSRELSNSLHDTTSITQAGITLADDFVEDTVAAIKDDRSIESNCFYEY